MRRAGSILVTLVVVAILILSVPAGAVKVSIKADRETVQKGGTITFNVSVELTSPDQYIPIQMLSLNLTGAQNVTWYFYPNGTLISGSGVSITPAGNLGPYGYGNGYGYAYDDGNYYNFSYGYGYGDNSTYVMNYTITIDTSQLTTGSYTAAAYVYTGKSIKPYFSSPKVSFTVTSPPPPGGGGGVGAVTIPPGTFKIYIGIIKPGETKIFNISADGAIYFHTVKIAASDWIAGGRITGKTIPKPGELPSAPAKHILAYIRIDATITPGSVSSVEINFRVPKRWLRERDAGVEQVRLYRYEGGEWHELPTEVSGEDAVYVYYTAKSPGFSYFAIAAVEKAEEAVTRPVTEEKPEIILPPPPEEEVKPPAEEAPPEEAATGVPEEKPEFELPKPVVRWVVVLIALVVILAALAVVADYYYYRKKRRR